MSLLLATHYSLVRYFSKLDSVQELPQFSAVRVHHSRGAPLGTCVLCFSRLIFNMEGLLFCFVQY